MASLPSYQEATLQPHWLSIVAPYISVAELARLCLVDTRFYLEFAPRIWKDPLKTIRFLGHDPADDTRRLHSFLTGHVDKMRLATRSLVLCLDFRGLDLTPYRFFEQQIWEGQRGKGKASRLASAFPRLRCILLDETPEWLAESIASDLDVELGPESPTTSTTSPLLMLTARKVATLYRPALFRNQHVHSLVYLDLSYTNGSLKAFFRTSSLPYLRILKVQGREMDDDTALSIFSVFKHQLWSLDISDNNLTDALLEPMVLSTFPATTLRTAAHYNAEGKLSWEENAGNPWYGRFGFVEESEQSSVFNHPRRYLADPPAYYREAELDSRQCATVRHNGRRPIRLDSPEKVKQILLGGPDQLPQSLDDIERHEICAAHGGITHLRLNGGSFSVHGIEKMVRSSPGQLEHFECDTTLIDSPRGPLRSFLPSWLKTAGFTGFLGASHLFRPVYSPHLQVLRVHHSLLTQIPSIKAENVTVGESSWIAETFFEPRAVMAYPQVFVPDMNPRLYSLTLTNVPRYSTGPLIEKILGILRQASIQERAIQDTKAGQSHRVAATLRGLRHLHLEFGEDTNEVAPDTLDLADIDATKLLSLDDAEFSFFGRSGWDSSAPLTSPAEGEVSRQRDNDVGMSHIETHVDTPEEPPPYCPGHTETCDDYEDRPGHWHGQDFLVPVWVGTGVPGPHRAVNEYMRLLQDPALQALHDNIGPASPGHVLAGVPAGSYIYHAAWDAILAPPVVRKPTKGELGAMRDVVAAIKEYRGQTKASLSAVQEAAESMNVPLGEPHYHWSGKLEISFPSVSHETGMWR